MASITPRRSKSGEIISYRIRVSRGYDSNGTKLKPFETTWKPSPNMTERQIQKELNRQATIFEERCKQGGCLPAAESHTCRIHSPVS